MQAPAERRGLGDGLQHLPAATCGGPISRIGVRPIASRRARLRGRRRITTTDREARVCSAGPHRCCSGTLPSAATTVRGARLTGWSTSLREQCPSSPELSGLEALGALGADAVDHPDPLRFREGGGFPGRRRWGRPGPGVPDLTVAQAGVTDRARMLNRPKRRKPHQRGAASAEPKKHRCGRSAVLQAISAAVAGWTHVNSAPDLCRSTSAADEEVNPP